MRKGAQEDAYMSRNPIRVKFDPRAPPLDVLATIGPEGLTPSPPRERTNGMHTLCSKLGTMGTGESID